MYPDFIRLQKFIPENFRPEFPAFYKSLITPYCCRLLLNCPIKPLERRNRPKSSEFVTKMAETKRPRALINGFGRIGRLALRRVLGFAGVDLSSIDVVAINDPLAVAESAAYLLEFDSMLGRFGSTTVAEDGESFSITTPGGKESTFKFTRAKTPAEV